MPYTVEQSINMHVHLFYWTLYILFIKKIFNKN